MDDQSFRTWLAMLPLLKDSNDSECVSVQVVINHVSNRVDVHFPVRGKPFVDRMRPKDATYNLNHNIHYRVFIGSDSHQKAYDFAHVVAGALLLPLKRW